MHKVSVTRPEILHIALLLSSTKSSHLQQELWVTLRSNNLREALGNALVDTRFPKDFGS
jgi:hypothetical protein